MSNLNEQMQERMIALQSEYRKVREKVTLTADSAWDMLQQAIADIVAIIEDVGEYTPNSDKKKAAMIAVTDFFDGVIYPIQVTPRALFFLEPVVDAITRKIFLSLASGSIDATVKLLRKLGVFKKKEETNVRES